MSMDEATDALEAELGAAVRRQMISDVPLGAFLSGGIDSSTIVALMQAGSSRRVSTFSIGFHEAPYDEAPHAKAVAAHLGTDHTELYVSLDDARTVVPQLASIYSEPFADASQIPTALLCRLARRHVTVALSGDAGDELFGGYNRHAFADRWWPKLQRVPLPLRRWASRACLSIGQGQWDRAYGAATFLMRAERRTRLVGEKLHKLAGVVDSRDGGDLYELLMAPAPARGFTTGPQPESPRWRGSEVGGLSLPEQMMLVDGETYLPDDVLVKVDRAAMAASLETRVPFLDHHVVELAWRMPQAVKLHDGKGKKVLRHLLARYVPPALTERSKMGFSVPIGSWLRGPLREWAEVLLSPELLERGALLNPEPIRRLWHAHLSGQGDHPALLWNALMFQAWRQHWNLWE
jgi:asparagine synthase (glutamine-hydrolysing)